MAFMPLNRRLKKLDELHGYPLYPSPLACIASNPNSPKKHTPHPLPPKPNSYPTIFAKIVDFPIKLSRKNSRSFGGREDSWRKCVEWSQLGKNWRSGKTEECAIMVVHRYSARTLLFLLYFIVHYWCTAEQDTHQGVL